MTGGQHDDKLGFKKLWKNIAQAFTQILESLGLRKHNEDEEVVSGFSWKAFFTGFAAFLMAFLMVMPVYSIRRCSRATGNIVATVGSQDVTITELNQVFRQLEQMAPSNDNLLLRKANFQQAREFLIQEHLWLEESSHIGWRSTPADVEAYKANIFIDPQTNKFSKEYFRRIAEMNGLTETEFNEKIAEEIMKNKMQSLLNLPPYEPKNIVKDLYKLYQTLYVMEYVVLEPNSDILSAKVKEKAQEILNNPEELKALQDIYEKNKDKYVQKSAVKLSSILIGHKDARSISGAVIERSKQEAQDLAQKTLQRLKKGENFASVAKEINDEKQEIKENGGQLGWVEEGYIDNETYQAALKLTKDNNLSEVIDTPVGFRLILLEDKREGILRSFDDVKGELAYNEAKRKVETEISKDLANAAKNLLQSENPDIDSFVQKYNLTWKKLKNPLKILDEYVDTLGSAPELMEKLIELKNPKDLVKDIIYINKSPYIFRLVEKQNQDTIDDNILKSEKMKQESYAAMRINRSLQKKLYAKYMSEKIIHINTSWDSYFEQK